MGTDVTIKANGHGIIVILPNDCDFNRLIYLVRQKFMTSGYYFKGKGNINISFSGRNVTNAEKNILIREINSIPDINTKFEKHTEVMLPALQNKMHLKEFAGEKKEHIQPVRDVGLFCCGTLLKGDILEVKKSIVVMGDVEAGARVISSGNIIITGRLLGSACAGRNNYNNRFILASYMKPEQVSIGRKILKLTRRERKKLNTKDAVMAYILGCNIVFEPLPFTNYSNDKQKDYRS